MGRKSIERERRPLTTKTRGWMKELVPLIQDKDLESLTLDDLSRLAGKSKSTIYSYFSTKEEIYQTAVELILEDLSVLITPAAIQGENMETVLRNILFQLSDGLQGITMGFLEQIQNVFPDVWAIIEQFTNELLANIERIYIRGMEDGTFREFNMDLLLALDRHFVISIITDSERFENQDIHLNDLVEEYIELRLAALRIP